MKSKKSLIREAKGLAEASPISFFMFHMEGEYPEFERMAAENLAKMYPRYFLAYGMHKKYPEFILLINFIFS